MIALSADLRDSLQRRIDTALDELRVVARDAARARPDGRLRSVRINKTIEYLCQQLESLVSDERDARTRQEDSTGKIRKLQKEVDRAIEVLADVGRLERAGRRDRKSLELDRREAALAGIEEEIAAEVARIPAALGRGGHLDPGEQG